jgi:anti-sigma factor (TIGR02949 family)
LSHLDYRSCAQVFARLDDYVDRELSADDLRQIERHLETCAVCAAEFRLEGDLLRTIRGKIRRIALPPGLESRIWRRLADAAREGGGRR